MSSGCGVTLLGYVRRNDWYMGVTQERVLELLGAIKHPAMKNDIVSLGILQDLSVSDERVSYILRLIEPNDPFGGSLLRASRRALEGEFPGVSIEAAIQEAAPVKVEQPPRKGGVGKVKNIVCIASGKGGVGKSTLTVNLAVALARKGYSVGVIDADVFGPSMPIMLGVEDERPEVLNEDGEDLIVPVEAYGVKMLSMGFFVPLKDALVWRGPMASNGLKQLLGMGLWGELDYLLIDTPPGTSDIHLTVVQEMAVAGAVIVSTPQHVALADAQKAMSMFSNQDVGVPILGIVENMAWFTPEELPENKYYIFGKGGAEKLASELKVPFLGAIPIVQGIREGGDVGCPIASDSSIVGDAFDQLATAFVEQVDWRNENLPPTVQTKSGR